MSQTGCQGASLVGPPGGDWPPGLFTLHTSDAVVDMYQQQVLLGAILDSLTPRQGNTS